MKKHLWQDLAVLILSIILFIPILISVRKENQPCQGQTAIAFGAEVCLIKPSADPPLSTTYTQPKLIRTFKIGDDVEPIFHMVYEVDIDGETMRYVEVINRND